MTDNADAERAQFVVFTIRQRLRGSHHDALAGMNAQRVEVLHVANGNAVVIAVAHDFVLNFFPTLETLLHEHLRREGEGLLNNRVELFLVVAEARAQSAQGISRTDNHRIAQFGRRLACLLGILASVAANGLDVNLIELLNKELTVFGIHNDLNGRTQHLHAIALEDAGLRQSHTAVERRLSAKSEQNTLGLLTGNDFFYKVGRNRKEINLVGHTFGSLHGGNIGVNENGLDSLLLQSLESL